MPRNVSRRDFVKGAALAVAAPTIISARALGNADTPPPSERLTIGFIGLGKQGAGAHLNPLSNRADFEILAISDVHTGRRDRAMKTVLDNYAKKERKASLKDYLHFQEVIDRKDISSVLIAAPDHWHTAISMAACAAGKDIYCEKPLTLTLHEAKVLMDTVSKYKIVFQTGSQQRSTGPFRQACEYVRSGRLGKIKEILVGLPGVTSKPCDLPGEPTPEGIEWDIWLGQAPQREYNDILCRKESDPNKYPFNPGWRDYIEFSGGMLTDWGAHHFDIVQWALDQDHAGPNKILAPADEKDLYNASFVYDKTPFGDNIKVTHVKQVVKGEFMLPPQPARGGRGRRGGNRGAADQANAQPSTQPSMRHFEETNGILFIGEKGRLFVNRGIIFSDPDTILKMPLSAGDVQLRRSPNSSHHDDWLECIKTRKNPITDAEIGARSVAVCHLMNLAYWHRKNLTWDPIKWQFVNDPVADSWRDRVRRPKYDLPKV